jgi:hypothetical protein
METNEFGLDADWPPDDDGAGGVLPLDPQLTAWVQRRAMLATAWAQSMAHGGPGAAVFAELVYTEDVISTRWPEVWAAHARQWAIEDGAKIHSEATPTATCPTCRRQGVEWLLKELHDAA